MVIEFAGKVIEIRKLPMTARGLHATKQVFLLWYSQFHWLPKCIVRWFTQTISYSFRWQCANSNKSWFLVKRQAQILLQNYKATSSISYCVFSLSRMPMVSTNAADVSIWGLILVTVIFMASLVCRQVCKQNDQALGAFHHQSWSQWLHAAVAGGGGSSLECVPFSRASGLMAFPLKWHFSGRPHPYPDFHHAWIRRLSDCLENE